MRHVATRLILTSLLSLLSASACGSDEGERGLTPPASDEVAAPQSEAEDRLTEAERQKQQQQQEEQTEAQEFDAGEGANP